MVIVPKWNDIRLCVEFRYANKVVISSTSISCYWWYFNKRTKIHQFKRIPSRISIFSFNSFSEGFIYLRTPKANEFLQSFWGMNQFSATSTSQNIDFGQFGVSGTNFGPKNEFYSSFSLIIKSVLKIDLIRI